MTTLAERLDTIERGEWRKQRAIISKGKEEFWTFIEAIRVVRDRRLYREEFKSFEQFVEQECGFKRNYINKLIEASDVKQELGTIVPKLSKAAEIQTEGQLRELTDVPKDELENVVEKAAEIAGDKPITAKVIKEAKEAVLAPPADDQQDELADDPQPVAASVEVEYVDDDDPPADVSDEPCRLNEFKRFWFQCEPVTRAAIRVWVNEQD